MSGVSDVVGIITDGVNRLPKQATVSTVNATGVASGDAMAGGIITSTTAAAVTMTTDTAAAYLTALKKLGFKPKNNDVYDLTVRNLGAANAITLAAGTNVSLPANIGTITTGTSLHLKLLIVDSTGVANPSVSLY